MQPNNLSCRESVVIAVAGTDVPPISFEQLEEAVFSSVRERPVTKERVHDIFKIEQPWE